MAKLNAGLLLSGREINKYINTTSLSPRWPALRHPHAILSLFGSENTIVGTGPAVGDGGGGGRVE